MISNDYLKAATIIHGCREQADTAGNQRPGIAIKRHCRKQDDLFVFKC